MNDKQENHPIHATLVSDEQRLNFLPFYFGTRLMLRGENLVYSWLRNLSVDYDGGFWDYYTLTNHGFYMAPKMDRKLLLRVAGNGFEGELSADGAGIVATIFGLGQLAAEAEGTESADTLIDSYYFLHAFAAGHPEASKIFAAID